MPDIKPIVASKTPAKKVARKASVKRLKASPVAPNAPVAKKATRAAKVEAPKKLAAAKKIPTKPKAVLPGVAAKPAAAPAPAAAPKPVSLKPKLVRDSFTMPRSDFALIDQLKERALGFKRPTKKSELLRAGLQALAGQSDGNLKAALDALTPLKSGRPAKAGK